MLSYQNNDTLRKNIKDDGYIKYDYPYTIEDQKIFKDILDAGKVIFIPYVKNASLSTMYEHPILICNNHGECTAYRNNSNSILEYAEFEISGSFIDYIRYNKTLTDYNYIEDTTLRCCVFDIKEGDKNAKLSK